MTTSAREAQPLVQQTLREARRLIQQDRSRGLVALSELFDAGITPDSKLMGRFAGQFEAFKIGPGLSQLAEGIDQRWRPWQGKIFKGAEGTGDNLLRHNTFALCRLAAPSYTAFRPDTHTTYRAFPFETYVAPARDNPMRQVLKIDYNLPVNPRWSVRRVVDELVQIDHDLFLGKAYIKWWWSSWQQWASFSLRGTMPGQ